MTRTQVERAPTDAGAARAGASLLEGVGSGLLSLPDDIRSDGLRRRVTYLMLFRLIVISLVLGTTLLLSRWSDTSPWSLNSIAILGIIVGTYVLSILYAVTLRTGVAPKRLATIQLVVDMFITALLVHLTGGALSAYTFFFPLSIIAAAAIHFRKGAVLAALASTITFCLVSVAGWQHLLPTLPGHPLGDTAVEAIEFSRALALNITAFAGVAVLAFNLGGQIQLASESLATQRTRTADLQVLHRDIVRSLSSALITVDGDNDLLTANEVAYQIFGATPKQWIGLPLSRLSPELNELVRDLPERDSLERQDIVINVAERGRCVLGVTISPLRNNQDEVIGRIIHCQDLTEIQRMEEQVRRNERLASIGRLAASIAHELRNPLASISGSLQVLSIDPNADEDTRTLTEIVHREVERLNKMLTELLDYSNPQAHESVVFDSVELVQETLAVFAHDPKHEHVRVGLASNSTNERLWLCADPNRIKQVLWNLLLNAVQAAMSAVEVRVTSEPVQEQVLIEILDDGPGIDPEHLEKLFEPFFTTKEQGTGLGLATCHSVVTEHGGTIEVNNLPTGGCCFSVRLPLSSEPK